MRIQINNTDQVVHDLAATIEKDPLSMDAWKCTYLNISENLPEGILNSDLITLCDQYQDEFKECDGDIIFCSDGDVLIISKAMSKNDMHVLAMDMCGTLRLPAGIDTMHYDLSVDCQDLCARLQEKTVTRPPSLDALLEEPESDHQFGEVEFLQDVFETVKQTRQSRNPMHILLVEDDKLTRRLVSNVFKDKFAIITANNAEEAMTNYLLHAPDIVFLDINLPDTSGFEVLKQVIAMDKSAYVVMFSGNSYLDNVMHAMTHGASGFIAKPFKRDKLEHYIYEYGKEHHKHVM